MLRIAAPILLVATISVAIALEASPNDRPRPLDLPVGSSRDQSDGGIDADTEDADIGELAETVSFYGVEIEGDAFFWCLDKSGSMSWRGDFGEQQGEVIAAMEELGDDAEFGVVAVSSGVIRWNPRPRKGTPENRESAIEWVRALEPAGESCLTDGVIETLALANFSRARTRQVIVSSDGAPSCGEMSAQQGGTETVLDAIARANWQHLEIHTIQIGSAPAAGAFLLELSRRSGGTYQRPAASR